MSNSPSQLAITASALLGFAIGNRTAVANAISQAKEKLGITKPTRSLTDTDKAAIVALWQEQYNATDDKQTDFVELVESIAAPVINEPIETAPAIIEQVETITPAIDETTYIYRHFNKDGVLLYVGITNNVETRTTAHNKAAWFSDSVTIKLEKFDTRRAAFAAELIAIKSENPTWNTIGNNDWQPTQTHDKDALIAELKNRVSALQYKSIVADNFTRYGDLETVRIAFYIGDKRTVIALSGFYLNALMLAAGIDKKGIPAWIKNAVDSWGAFDPALNVTEQVKLLIVRELEKELIKARG